MGTEVEKKITYFEKKGSVNTDRTLEIALAACEDRKIKKIVVASSTGETALKLYEKAGWDMEIIAVTYSAGSRFADEVEQFLKNRELMIEKGIQIVRGMHALSATERGFENKYKNKMTPLNIVSDTLRMFSHGVKVCVEVSIMAAEAGFVTPDEDVVVIAGSGGGADTAAVLKPAYAAGMFETKFRALLCMPV
ncbi:MAG: pyruvate kinase alpha/beta domain-containing protein [Pseudomonadota bacterium]